MMKHLIVDQPADPIGHLVKKLEQSESKLYNNLFLQKNNIFQNEFKKQ